MENENEQVSTVTTRSVGVKYGLIMGIVAILYFVLMVTLNVDQSEGAGRWGSLIFYIALIYLAHKNFKDNGDGYMSYGEGTGIVFWMALICCAISSAFTYVYIKFIDNSFVQKMMEKQEEKMIERGMSSEQVDQAMRITEKFMTPEMMFIFGLIGGFIIIMIIGLLVNIFTKKARAEMSM